MKDRGSTFVSVTFDDGWACQHDAASVLSAHGLRGTFYVNSTRIGSDGYLTWGQLADLEAAGHEIGGHGLDHLDLTQLSAEEVRRQVEDDRAGLVAHGFAPQSFAYPFGAHDATAQTIVRECGYSSGRGAWGLRNITAARDKRAFAERIPPQHPYAISTPCCIDSSTPLSALESYVEQAKGRGGGWVPFVLHRVCDDGVDTPAASMGTATFAAFVAVLAEGAPLVRTVADMTAAAAD